MLSRDPVFTGGSSDIFLPILSLGHLILKIIFVGYFQDTLFEEINELHFVSAEAEVVQAIDLCVVLMNTGEVAEIMADPEMAYGKINVLLKNSVYSLQNWGKGGVIMNFYICVIYVAHPIIN